MQMISDDTKAAEKWERKINCYQRFLLLHCSTFNCAVTCLCVIQRNIYYKGN